MERPTRRVGYKSRTMNRDIRTQRAFQKRCPLFMNYQSAKRGFLTVLLVVGLSSSLVGRAVSSERAADSLR